MYTFACKDLGMDCDHVITADRVADIVTAANAHAMKVHMKELQAMPADQLANMNKIIESKIKRA